MKVVILCGGKGMRLRQETDFKPKAMVEIGEQPIIWHIMKIYSHYGFNDFLLCLGYKGDVIRYYMANYELMHYDCSVWLGTSRKPVSYKKTNNEKWKVTLVNTGDDSETGMRIKLIEPFVKKENFMLTYADGLADINIKQLLRFHNLHNRDLTVTGVYPTERFGIIKLDKKSNVKTFLEKPTGRDPINAGFMVCKPSIFKYIKENIPFEKEPIHNLARENRVACFQHKGFWHCMDTFRDFIYLNDLWDNGNAPWKTW